MLKDLLIQIAGKIKEKLESTDNISPVNFPNLIYTISGKFFTRSMFDTTGRGLTNIIRLKFKDNISSIEENAFSNLYIEDIELNENIEIIKKNAFSSCKNITKIVIPSSVTTIGSNAFQNCTNLENVSVDAENPVYDSRDNCNAIINTETNTLITGCKSTTIPDNVIYIGDAAFYGINCSENSLPAGLKGIGKRAFSYASGIQHFNCLNLEEIGENAFYNNATIEMVTIGSSLKKIGGAAFRSCNNLKEFHVDSLQHWCNITFVNYMSTPMCNTTCNLYINDTLLGDTLIIPEDITTINAYTFAYCSSLKNVTLHDKISSMGNGAFQGCLNIENVLIPNKITKINDSVFKHCTNLKYIDFTNYSEIPTLSNVSAFQDNNCKFIVPDDLYNRWVSATNWSTYADRIIKASEYTES